MRKVRVAVCMPWYKGPDESTVMTILALQHYLGKLEERSRWIASAESTPLGWGPYIEKLPWLTDNPDSELTMLPEPVELDFCLSVASNISLPGMAREAVTNQAIDMGADILFSYDYDMLVRPNVFMRLLADVLSKEEDVPVVAALAFTGRYPIAPVIYKSTVMPDGRPYFEPMHDYKRNALQRVDGFGTGTFMARAEIFKKIPQPWFNLAGGMGEDLFFTGVRCPEFGIPVHVDTRAKVDHKPTVPLYWHNEELYESERRKMDVRTEEEKEMGDEA